MMRRRSAVLLAIVLALTAIARRTTTAQGTADRAGITRAALDYVEGFYEGDTAKLVRSIRPDVYKYGFDWLEADKRYAGEQMKWDEILGYARRFREKGRTTPATAPKKVDLLDVMDQTASAKVTAWWGTDYLLLARYDGKWMITHVLWQSPTPTR
ncbi:MAG: nuclear transport factor 2 family protein [Gemmatimonadaceae bacterium]